MHEAGAKASQECDLGHRLALAISSGMRHGKDSKDGDRDQCQWMYSVFGVIEGQLQGHPLVISMMLRAPEASCLLLASALDSCKRLAEKEVIPKDDRALQTVTTLMFLQDDDTLHTKQHVNLPDVKRKAHPPPKPATAAVIGAKARSRQRHRHVHMPPGPIRANLASP